MGFVVLNRAEGPSVPFEFIFQRFTKGPRFLVYDNACWLHAYCLKREPEFFAHTYFFVDRFHWKGHKGCCECYNIDAWPRKRWVISPDDVALIRRTASERGIELPPDVPTMNLEQLNSEATEQYNSRLRYMSTPLTFKAHRTFVEYMVMFCYR